MLSNNPIEAANPEISAIVKASAGVGKTYLLVTRLLRLLLADVRPDAILAITFTRKAAAEMQSRLFERLYQLAIASESEVSKELENIGVDVTPAMIQSARQLYEKLMRSEYQVRTSTFHAFCQEILRKFPLEAEVPPGFELLDDENAFRSAAWDALYDKATQDPQSNIAQALESLYELSNGLHNTHQSLDNFLNQRSDWWAYTQGQKKPVKYAIQHLLDDLKINPEENPYHRFFTKNNQGKLSRLVHFLNIHDTKTNLKNADKLQTIIESELFITANEKQNLYIKPFNELYNFFINKEGDNKNQKSVKSRAKKIGEDGETEFLTICQDFSTQLLLINELCLKHHNFHLSSAWYTAGDQLITSYQKIKTEQRLLDFVDLEWNTYQLLNHSDNALWVQYKLDQRIDHMLIDEFQDTNPTQWRLILPLLEEFANQPDNSRSVFIVGDEKQSIYSFRRADPRLLNQAGQWLENNLFAKTFPMDKSRRSSTAVMDLLNSLFKSAYFENRLPGFHDHSTFLNEMPGQITLLPIIEKEKSDTEAIYFRNSLEEPLLSDDQPYYREGQQIAEHINHLIRQKTGINSDNGLRPATYSDIMLLVRSRTHVADYEQALREANIPYLSNNKGTLFECQEIQDLMALMDVLYTPYNNLALATALRSPIFQCSNDDLISIVSAITDKNKQSSWFELINQLNEKKSCSENLEYAINCLNRWRTLSGHLPIHDLLDMIFHEADIFNQYEQQIPDHFKHRVHSNLSQFLSLALEIESGRYPSLGRFISKLRSMVQNDDSPDEVLNESHEGAIRILTIHASKGLEAPIVFLADSADAKSGTNNSYQALIQWPENEEKPTQFLLCPIKNKQAEHIKNLLQINENKSNIEDANLLYVALTRARQALFISGCRTKKQSNPSWYSLIEDNWPECHLHLPICDDIEKIIDSETLKPDLDQNTLLFSKPANYCKGILPELDESNNDNESTIRGTMIHRVLELIEQYSIEEIKIQILEEFSSKATEPVMSHCIKEAQAVFTHEAFAQFFNSELYNNAINEMPVLVNFTGNMKPGIIDRVVITDTEVFIIDYKSHSDIDLTKLPNIADEYQQQMSFYAEIAKKLWPKKRIRLIILFTHYLKCIEISNND